MLELKPLKPGLEFAAEASGLDLKKVGSREAKQIEEAMNRFAVLVWRGQPLTEEQQIALGAHFGPLDTGLKKARKRAGRYAQEEIIDISNVTPEGGLYERASAATISNLANQLWHSDSSFQKPSAKFSMLSAVVVPKEGGQTEFADLRAAYDSLPVETKKIIENLSAEHYAWHSREWLGDTITEEQARIFPPVQWPLVRTHPGSGRKVLFIGIHCTKVVGATLAEGRMLLAELMEHATQREFVYRHEWRVGDLVMWDNRCTVHRGRRFDLAARRELRRVTSEDASPEEMQA
jgi:alpha-ketoglutarate-dependent 2,4-dichlorophenoxyacetate dioxygenase